VGCVHLRRAAFVIAMTSIAVLQPNRPTTTPGVIVTPAVSPVSCPNYLISLACVAVSACPLAGGCR
jgi:hypothetical protein